MRKVTSRKPQGKNHRKGHRTEITGTVTERNQKEKSKEKGTNSA